jgi:uncharacterized protein YuzE
MRWSYDLAVNALFVFLTDETAETQIEMPDHAIVDVDVAGRPVAIEVLGPNRGWDVDAIISQFQIDDATAESLRMLHGSPLLNGPGRKPNSLEESVASATNKPQLVTTP